MYAGSGKGKDAFWQRNNRRNPADLAANQLKLKKSEKVHLYNYAYFTPNTAIITQTSRFFPPCSCFHAVREFFAPEAACFTPDVQFSLGIPGFSRHAA
ncbi:hypothetical protein, partial [Bacillus marinisedimentorum]|uniref:hypothetical protein n=1 Tax=Bacillus marinisedimentorum TaxID=1821260 RepID=UPI001B8005D2